MKKHCTKSFSVSWVFIGLLVLSACGYSPRRKDVVLGNKQNRQSLFVPIVDNITTRGGIEAIVTNALRENLASIRGVELVDNPEEASYLLLGTIRSFSRRSGVSSVTGSPTSAAQGGLAQDQITAAEIHLELVVQMKLVEKVTSADAATPLRKLIWDRPFSESANFETSRRFTEATGSSSTVHINDSRELIQVRILSQKIAQKIFDQVVQDF